MRGQSTRSVPLRLFTDGSQNLGLGRGQTLPQVLAGMTQVAEGVRTAKSVHDLARKLGVEMPLHEAIYRILYEGLSPKAALQSLTSRELKSEFQLH